MEFLSAVTFSAFCIEAHDVIENARIHPLVGAYVSSSARKTSKLPGVLNIQQNRDQPRNASGPRGSSIGAESELVAELPPKPDVPTTLRKLPERRKKTPTMKIQLVPDRARSTRDPTTPAASLHCAQSSIIF